VARLLRLLTFAVLVCLSCVPSAAEAGTDCPEGLVCTNVSVPLDRTGAVPGTIDLPVVSEPGNDPLLIFLGGGPGQGMTQYADYAIPFYSSLMPGYRVAFLDQRGTGQNAISCPSIQFAALTDLTSPPRGSIETCGRKLGDTRGFYSTADTVADLDAVRQALGAGKLSLFGVSYGTYVAEMYARAHPEHTGRLVLDSVVPQENVGPFFDNGMRRSAVVFRQLCRLGVCRGVTQDPVRDLAKLVKRTDRKPIMGRVRLKKGHPRERVSIDGVVLYDMTISLASFDPKNFAKFPAAISKALDGRPARLLRLALATKKENATPDVESLSWGAHTATLCADIKTWPWGGADTPVSGRYALTVRAAKKIPARRFAPFDRKTATGNGALVSCQRWQRTEVPPVPDPGPLPKVPTLIFAGGWDLSTPIPNAREEARRSSTEKLVVIPRSGHAQAGYLPCTYPILRRFFTDRPLGHPCAGHKPDL